MSILINNKSIEDILKEKVLAFGGLEEDLKLLKEEDFDAIAKALAEAGIKSRTPNPAFIVNPINSVEGIQNHFDWVYDWITPKHCPLKSVEGAKTIELIKCKPGETEDVLKEIDERGFYPAPSNYVLGLGVEYPETIKEYQYIVSLDENNVFTDEEGHPCFLVLHWHGSRYLSLYKGRAGEWDGGWWFAVLRK